MAGNKYLELNNGEIQEVPGLQTSSGAPDANKIPALDTTGRLSQTMMPVGVGPETKALVASEDLVAGNLVNVWNDTGTPKVRKADCSNGRRCNGYVLEAYSTGQSALVRFESNITGLTGKTPGATQFLGTAGTIVETAPSTAGYISQQIGVAISDTEVNFEKQLSITLA